MENIYDVVIIGGGPAGLSAGLYAARAKLKTLILEKGRMGGQIAMTSEIANYPGSILKATGPTLVARMFEQMESFGGENKNDKVAEVDFTKNIKVVKGEAETYYTKTVIIANGAEPRFIGCPGEAKFTGKGVSYCATCDADFFTDLEVFVVGGGDSAVEEALYLTKFAKKVTIVHRRDALRAAKTIQEKAFKNPKIHFKWNATVAEIKGENVVDTILFKDTKTGIMSEYTVKDDDGMLGVFVFVGYKPISGLYKDKIEMNEAGYIKTDEDMHTSVPGVFAAGDIRVKSLRQVITAAADGAIAAVQAGKYIEEYFNQ
jgi:thioredoxin reductase (NADPH)